MAELNGERSEAWRANGWKGELRRPRAGEERQLARE
jgi:hypothetical protein